MQQKLYFLVCALCAMLFSVHAMGQDSNSIHFTGDDFYDQGTSESGSMVSETIDEITVSCNRAYGDGDVLCCYTGSIITITSNTRDISSIEFEFSDSYTGGLNKEVAVNSKTWSYTIQSSEARLTEIVINLKTIDVVITAKISAAMVAAYGSPYIYAWGDYSSNQWPGEPMVPIGDDMYRYTFYGIIDDLNINIVCGDIYTNDIENITSSTCYELSDYDEETDSSIPYRIVECTETTQPEDVIIDPLQQVVLYETVSVDTIIFMNDEAYPWEYINGYICSTNKSVKNSKSEFSFTYSSALQTQVQFEWINRSTNGHTLQCYVDGVYRNDNTSTSAWSQQFCLPAGTHVVTFRDSVSSIASSNSYDRTSGVHNIRIREIRPLETVVLAENSISLTFTNDAEHPWLIESDSSVCNGNYWYKSSTSSFSTTFTISEPSMFSFNYIAKHATSTSSVYTSTDYHKLTTYINGEMVWFYNGVTSYATSSTLLPPGTYTIKWEDWIGTYNDQFHSYIKNISVSSKWTEVELEYAGTLGVEVLYKHDVLTDVKCLKIKGNLNSTDWATIKQMTNLRGLDLSEASFTSVPANQFDGRGGLNYIVLPEGLQTIGDYAFQNTYLWNVRIPSTVTSIGQYAFAKSSVPAWTMGITFAENSQLQSLGAYCFSKSQLKRIALPNSVTSLGTYCFQYNSLMDSLILSDALLSLPNYLCRNCSNLSYVHFPSNLTSIGENCFAGCKIKSMILPQSLRTISANAFQSNPLDSIHLPLKLSSLGYDAFNQCTSLKYIQLPSSPSVGYDNTFESCTAVQTVVCPSATPPSITNDPFASARAKSAITLKVPSFAVATYKLHSYWYKFGTIVECDENEEPDFIDVASSLMLTNNRRPAGKPHIRVFTNGKLTVSGAAPMDMTKFELCCHPTSSSGAFHNTCPYVAADTAWAVFMMNEANKWYFITPLYDVDLPRVAENSVPEQFVFRYYNAANRASRGTGSSWQNVTDGILHQGQGYIVQSNNTGWMRFPSIDHSDTLLFRTEDVIVPLQTYASESAANESWNFIGNPYPCFYDIWYMDFTAPITVWTGSTYKAYSLVDDNYALRPMEAFFVQKPEDVSQLIFRKEGRQVTTSISHSNTEGAPMRRVPAASNRKVYNLSILAANGLSDDARVVINDAASLSYELTCDASKFMSMDAECPQIYTIDGEGNRLSINERPLDNGIVALGMYIPNAGEYTLSAVATSDITLVDNQLGISHDLHSAPYIFSTDMAGENSARFALVFGPRPISTGIENIDSQKAEMGGAVYTLDGRCVGRISGSAELQSLHLPAGVYMIQSGNTYNKVIVR